jgi:hypothetical protein
MKIDMAADELDCEAYNLDNGQGAAEMAINALRATNDPYAEEIEHHALESSLQSARDIRSRLDDPSREYVAENGVKIFEMGIPPQAADSIRAATDEIVKTDDESDLPF